MAARRPPDDDDWTGTPPEGRVARDRADPAYWRRSFPVATVAMAAVGLLAIVAVVIALA